MKLVELISHYYFYLIFILIFYIIISHVKIELKFNIIHYTYIHSIIINMLLKKSLSSLNHFSKFWDKKNSLLARNIDCKYTKNINFNIKFLSSRSIYSFSAVSINDIKISYDPSKKTEIISLNQLCNLSHLIQNFNS